MAHPWANVFILLVGGTSLVTGFLGLIGGSADWTIALHVHRVSGYALAALLLWKGRNILMSLTKPAAWRQRPALMLGSIAIFTLLLAAMGLGIYWSYGGYFTYLGFSGVSWHIYLSLAACPASSLAHLHPLLDPAPPLLGAASFLLETGRTNRRRPRFVARR